MTDDIKPGDVVNTPRGYEAWYGSTVLAVDGHSAWLRTRRDSYVTMGVSALTKVPTFPEQWINVYPKMVGSARTSRRQADLADGWVSTCRIGVIHIHEDGTLEMEKP